MMKPKKPVVGPITKKAAKKATPKVPLTSAGTAVKKKKMANTAVAIGSSIVGTVGMIAADARLRRGGLRIQDKNKNIGGNAPEPTMRQRWNAGKNKKSTKK